MSRALAILFVILLAGAASSSCSRAGYSGPPEKINIGFSVGDTSVLLLIAEDQGFFAANGLDMTLKTYDTAVAALKAMTAGEVDIAETAEFPIVSEAFRGSDIKIVAGIDRFDIISLVGRKDRGIQSISDLRGKRIGVPKGTVAEFYLGRFLELNGISLQDVSFVNAAFQQVVDALPGGTVDAFQVRFKDIETVNERLGGNIVIWPSQNSQMGFEVLSAQNDWITGHHRTAEKLMKALLQAESFAVKHPAEARAIARKRLGHVDAYMTALTSQHRYSLTLDRALIAAMEDEARWMIGANLTGAKQVPNFPDYVYEAALKKMKPEAVNIIR